MLHNLSCWENYLMFSQDKKYFKKQEDKHVKMYVEMAFK